MAALPIWMPLRNEHATPTFDASQPRELTRYFQQLELLMDRAHITDKADKKKEAVYYVDFNTEQYWKAIPEFEDQNKSYKEFKKKALLTFYPDASDNFLYSLRDLDLLISTATPIPPSTDNILTAKNLAPFMAEVTKSIVDALRGPNTHSHHRNPNRLVVPTPVQTIDYLYEDIDDVSERIAAIKAEIASLDALEMASKPLTATISISQLTGPEHQY